MKIGFIGMGIMGKPMAINLVKKGYTVFVSNRHMEACDGPVKEGAVALDYKGVAEKSDVIFTMLPNGPEVKSVVLGDNGLINYMKKGQIFVDCSSIAPDVSQEINEELKKKGIEMLDAPVSGGEPKAIDGTLAFMVGGDEDTFNLVKPLLLVMGSSAILCGDVGAGNTTKLCNQVIVAANIAALAEGLMLAKKAGVDPNTVLSAISGGLAGSTVMNAKGPMMTQNNRKPGFKIDLHIKDLNNAIDTGHKVGSPLPLTVEVMEMFQSLKADGFGQSDHSALSAWYEKMSNETIY